MKIVDGHTFLKGLKYGYYNLENHIEELNRLNVFPVPDGDTGINMAKTMSSVTNLDDEANIGIASNNAAKSILHDSRGNSGTILATFFLSLSRSFKNHESVDANDIINAFIVAHKTCYDAIDHPVEGTILTVMNNIAQIDNYDSIEDLFKTILKISKDTVNNTTSMLKELQENGVVDAGALGLYYLIEGAYNSLIENYEFFNHKEENFNQDFKLNTTYQYVIEGIIKKNKEYIGTYKLLELKDKLREFNKIIDFNESDTLVKFIVHSNHDGEVEKLINNYGILLNFQVDNVSKVDIDTNDNTIAIIVTISGDGFYTVFGDFDIQYFVRPIDNDASYGEYLKIVNSINIKNIILFTNNKNNILSANLLKKEINDKNIFVMQTKNEAECLICLSNFDYDLDIESNCENMNDALNRSKTLKISKASKDYCNNDLSVKKGEWILLDDEPIYSSNDLDSLILSIKKELDDFNIITLFYGTNISYEKAQEFKALLDKETRFSKDIYLYEGGQNIYTFIISGEK